MNALLFLLCFSTSIHVGGHLIILQDSISKGQGEKEESSRKVEEELYMKRDIKSPVSLIVLGSDIVTQKRLFTEHQNKNFLGTLRRQLTFICF